jgi:hypothetical protein
MQRHSQYLQWEQPGSATAFALKWWLVWGKGRISASLAALLAVFSLY